MRSGDRAAKLAAVPASEGLKALQGEEIDLASHHPDRSGHAASDRARVEPRPMGEVPD